MGKIFVLVISIFCFLFSADAQFKWGINTGVNLTNRQDPSDHLPKPLVTSQFSIFGLFPVSNLFSFQPSLGYHGKGDKFKNVSFTDNMGNFIGSGNINELFNYLQLNVLAQLRCNRDEDYKLYSSAGPYLAYLINGKSKLKDFHGSSHVPPGSSDINLYYINRFDAGLNLAASLIIKDHWDVSLTSSMGFVNTVKLVAARPKNMSVGITLGYLIH